jgi:hypothetical protein
MEQSLRPLYDNWVAGSFLKKRVYKKYIQHKAKASSTRRAVELDDATQSIYIWFIPKSHIYLGLPDLTDEE